MCCQKRSSEYGRDGNTVAGGGNSVLDKLSAQFDAPATGDPGQAAASKEEGELCNNNKGQCDVNGGCANIGGGGTIPDASCK